jgi:hypothetical protein
MPRWFTVVAALLICGAGAAGYATVPHYYRPASNGEDRLRERAAEYYRQAHLLRLDEMQKFFTPAHQVGTAEKLLKESAKNREASAKASKTTLEQLKKSVQSITPESLELQRQGNWAVTGGSYVVPGEGGNPSVPIPLENVVWLRTSGDWWVYVLEENELACYGNPPDFARGVVAKRAFDKQQRKLMTDPTEASKLLTAPKRPPGGGKAAGAAPPAAGKEGRGGH